MVCYGIECVEKTGEFCASCKKLERVMKSSWRTEYIERFRSIDGWKKRFCDRVRQWYGCFGCGKSAQEAKHTLHFHHIVPTADDTQISDLSCLAGTSMDELKNEMRKCVVLCNGCHQKAHS